MPIIDINARFGAYPARHRTVSYDDLAAGAKALGIDSSCVCCTTGIYYNSREGNAETAAACQSQPKQLIPAATLNPAVTLDPDKAVTEVLAGPFRVVRFFPLEQNWPVDFAPLSRCLKLLGERGLPAMISCSRSGDATQIGRLISEVAGELPVVLTGVSVGTLAEALATLRQCPSLLVETHRLNVSEALTALRDTVGAQRIVFGSGASAFSMAAALSFVNASPLTSEEKTQVLGANAAKLLKLS